MDGLAENYNPNEKKEQQILFEIIEKALKKQQQQVLQDFKKKHAQFAQWAQANKIQIVHVKNSLVSYVMASGFSVAMIGSTVLPAMQSTSPPPLQALSDSVATAAVLPGIDSSATISSTPKTTQKPVVTKSVTPVPSITPQPMAVPGPSQTTPTPSNTPNDVIAAPDQVPDAIRQKMEQYRQWPSEQIENEMGKLITSLTGVESAATLEGRKMNKLFGFFGKEQHLYRYPGDSLEEHAKTDYDKKTFIPSGIAPGLGAFGYFAPSKTQFTARDEMRERYYIAAQTFLFPGFYSDKGFKQWLRFKKVMVYNPKNGKAVVAVIGDAGPAQWTGKSFGGSPELMHHLQMVDGKAKSEAIVLFVDDPEDKIPLGPVNTAPKGTL